VTVTFQELYDAMRDAGIDVGVDLVGAGHRIVLADRAGGRELRVPVDGSFDRAAAVLVASARLREALRLYGTVERPDGALARGAWPEFLERWPATG
jgi:hypothetical protein